MEGAFIMGLGMMAQEQVIIDENTGKLMTDSTWNYKIPTAICIPQQLNVAFLKVSSQPVHGLSSCSASQVQHALHGQSMRADETCTLI